MASRVSARAAARGALAQEKAQVGKLFKGATRDSFVNFLQGVGMGAQNSLQGATYGFNPITRNRLLMEWIHRGSWLGGMAVDVIADDMTRKGAELKGDLDAGDASKIEAEARRLQVWDKKNAVIKWGRLYGGAIGVALIDGQDMRTPLRLESVGKGQFKGLAVLDRWMITPALEDLVTDLGPHLGMPKYYRVQDNAPALRGMVIHYSRVLFRHVGVELPYQQALTENLWGISIFERFYDRMIGFDQASMGAAQLVSKAYLRTLRVKDLRQLVAAGGEMMQGLVSYVHQMRMFQSNEGINCIDAEDEFLVQQTSAFSGVNGTLEQLGMQVSGALGIPLVRLFGQSPAGLSSSGESDWRNYYDNIFARQEKDLGDGTPTEYKLIARSVGVVPGEDFDTEFRPLLELSEKEKADVANVTTQAVTAAKEAGLLGAQTAMKELKQSGARTGIYTNITRESIEAADDEIAPPMSEQLLAAADYGGGVGKPGYKPPAAKLPNDDEDGDGKTRPNREAPTMDARPRRRVVV